MQAERGCTRGQQTALAAEEQAVGELVTDGAAVAAVRDTPKDKPRIDPTWAPPLTGQPWTGVDICQCVHPHSHPLYTRRYHRRRMKGPSVCLAVSCRSMARVGGLLAPQKPRDIQSVRIK